MITFAGNLAVNSPSKMSAFTVSMLLAMHCSWSQTYFPPTTGTQWDTLSPSSLNWCPDSIQALYDMLDQEGTDAFIVLKDGKIVLENYYGFYNINSTQAWNSASKSLRAVLVGIAQEEGLINIQNKTSDYIGTGWTNLPQNKEDLITVWHQLTMTSGLNEANFFCVSPWCLNYVADAGTRWAYHNGPYMLLEDVIISQAGGTLNDFTDTRLEQYIGMSGQWQTSLGNTTYHGSARDMARFGWLVMNDGNWDGTSVLGDQNYITAMRTPSQALNPSYGYLWWLNGQSFYVNTSPTVVVPGMVSPSAPPDCYSAAGANGQFISISPSLGLIMIRQGNGSGNYTEFELHDKIWKKIMDLDCTAGIQENEAFTPQVIPNPNNGSFTVQFPSVEAELLIEIYSAKGELKESCSAHGLDRIDVNTVLGPGLYFMKIFTVQGSTIQRMVIE